MDGNDGRRDAPYSLEGVQLAEEQYEIPVRNADRCGKGRWRWWLALALVIVLVSVVAGIGFKVYEADQPLPPPAVFLCRTATGMWLGAGAVALFRGLPYGVAGRWQLPEPAPCWKEKIFDASKSGPVCPQLVRPKPPLMESEQCLVMNVWTANLRSAKRPLPIIFFLHGGSNVVGSNEAFEHLEAFVQSKQACVFAPNIRIGVFGFLALKELSLQDRRNTSGNYGIEDIRLALKWVKEYASVFGCDPNSVTLMGQSSGATNIFALLTNPDNTGLFHGAIILSGSTNITQTLQSAEAHGRAVVTNAKCEGPDPLGCLRALPMLSVQAAMPSSWASTDFWPTDPIGIPNPGLLCVDGVTVKTDLVSAFTQSLVDVPIIMQSARADLILFPRREFVTMDAAKFDMTIAANFRRWPNNQTGDLLAEAYRESASVSVLRAWAELITDIAMYCGHIELATRALLPRTRRSPIYVSVVDQPPQNPFNFGTPDTCPPELKGDPTCKNIPYVIREPCHAWDYMVAARAWAQLVTADAPQAYVGGPKDEKLGDLLKSQWFAFATSKGIFLNQSAFDAPGSGFPANYMVNVQGDTNLSGLSRVVPNYRSSFCQLLKNNQLIPDSRFWLVN